MATRKYDGTGGADVFDGEVFADSLGGSTVVFFGDAGGSTVVFFGDAGGSTVVFFGDAGGSTVVFFGFELATSASVFVLTTGAGDFGVVARAAAGLELEVGAGSALCAVGGA